MRWLINKVDGGTCRLSTEQSKKRVDDGKHQGERELRFRVHLPRNLQPVRTVEIELHILGLPISVARIND
jgi:hypothetical protein